MFVACGICVSSVSSSSEQTQLKQNSAETHAEKQFFFKTSLPVFTPILDLTGMIVIAFRGGNCGFGNS